MDEIKPAKQQEFSRKTVRNFPTIFMFSGATIIYFSLPD
jgi:hypothetical protein